MLSWKSGEAASDFSQQMELVSKIFSNDALKQKLFILIRQNMYKYLGGKYLVAPKDTEKQIAELLRLAGNPEKFALLNRAIYGAVAIKTRENKLFWHVNFLAKRRLHYILLGYPVLAAFRDKNMPRMNPADIDRGEYFFIFAEKIQEIEGEGDLDKYNSAISSRSKYILVNFLDASESPLVLVEDEKIRNSEGEGGELKFTIAQGVFRRISIQKFFLSAQRYLRKDGRVFVCEDFRFFRLGA